MSGAGYKADISGLDLSVPSQDSSDNTLTSDVVGNKTDTVAGDSLVSLVKIVDELHDVPTQDSTAEATMSDVIGNRNDRSFSNRADDPSVIGHLTAGYYHVHSPAKCYPVLADPVTVTASANAWTDYGSWTEIIPASTIGSAFDIHWVHTGEISAQGNYVLELGAGVSGSETVIGQIAFSRDSNQVQTASQPIQIPPQPADTRISARLSSGNAVANTVDVKIYYHQYPDIS